VLEQLNYDSFGNSTGSSYTRYTYTGREFDSDTGLDYYRARFYDPQIGRFISEDPAGFRGSSNCYTRWYRNVLAPHEAKETLDVLQHDNARFQLVKELVREEFEKTFGECGCCTD